MAAAAKFLAAQILVAIAGAGAGFHPSVRTMSAASRAAISFGAGAVALTLEATLFSTVGIAWSMPALSIPLLLLSALCIARWRGRPRADRTPVRAHPAIAFLSLALAAMPLLYLALSLTSSSATSMDFLLFWGVKAIRFADSRGIAADFLRNPFSIHASVEYPPLVPILDAWGCLAAGKMPWRVVPAFSGLWLIAAVPLLFERCRRRLGDNGAATLVSFWTVALTFSMAFSYSGGNAEAPLLYFEGVALAWLLTEDGGETRFVPTMALCGAALTKVEGLAAVAFLAAGSFIREGHLPIRVRWARSLGLLAWPAAAVTVWFIYQASQALPVGYRSHGLLLKLYPDHLQGILKAMLGSMSAGALWVPWLLAIGFLILRAPAWRTVAPALLLASGILLFLVFDYLHDKDDPKMRIGWTTPRVTQPALSAVILAAGVLSFGEKRGKGLAISP